MTTTVDVSMTEGGPNAVKSARFPALEEFKEAFATIQQLPYCSGHVALDENCSKIFYQGLNGQVNAIDFLNPAEKDLAALAEACHPASFGRGDQDVLDDTYRKAGKMDKKEFATQFDPFENGIIDKIRGALLPGEKGQKEIRAEMYKLNVYGPGSFFKAHVDTPRSDVMFGSLVVVFPTQHEGGSLVFRHKGNEITFNTAQAVSSSTHPSPHAAYVAFFSDVEHEVSMVTSGYRVTLTYNLYFSDSHSALLSQDLLAVAPVTNNPADKLKPALAELLSNPEFLPKGGLFAFQLSHKYPFKVASRSTSLTDLFDRLKGSDALVKQTCEAVNLPVQLKAMYAFKENEYSDCMLYALVDKFVNFNGRDISAEEPIHSMLRKKKYGYRPFFAYPYPGKKPALDYYSGKGDLRLTPTVWVKLDEEQEKREGDKKAEGKKPCNSWDQQYMTYGNEMQLAHMYGEVCLVAKVKPAAERLGQAHSTQSDEVGQAQPI